MAVVNDNDKKHSDGQNRAEARGVNPELLKRDIDAGLTGDKVAAPDPAAAPLGTDDEAAGTPITPAQLAMAQRTERLQGAQAGDRAADFGDKPEGTGRATIVILAAVAAVVVLLVALI